MSAFDLLRFAWGALKGHRLRTSLTLLGLKIGQGEKELGSTRPVGQTRL